MLQAMLQAKLQTMLQAKPQNSPGDASESDGSLSEENPFVAGMVDDEKDEGRDKEGSGDQLFRQDPQGGAVQAVP